MYKDITASLVAATRKVVEASSIKAANEAAQKEQSSNLSKSMRPAYEGSAPRNAQEISLLREKAHTIPKTPKEKSLAALADDGKKDVITHADVMVGRGVKKEEVEAVEEDFAPLRGVKINHPKHGEGTIAGYTRPGLYKVNYKSGKDANHSASELEKHHDPESMKKVAQSIRGVKKEEVVTESKVGENEHVKVTHTSGDREDVYTVHDKKTGGKSKYGIHGYFDANKEKPQDTIKKQLQKQNVPSAAHDMIVKHMTEEVINEAKVGENEHVKVTHTAGDREDVYTVHDKKTGTKNKYGIHGYFDANKEKPQDTIKKQLKQHNVPSAAHDIIVKHMTEEVIDETMVNGKPVNNKIYKPGKSDAAFDYKTPRKPQDAPNRKSGDVTSTGHDVKKISTGMVYTKRFEEVEQVNEAPVDGVAPGSMEGDKHMCASKVMHKEWKEGKTLFSQHAEPNEIGLIEWYDVMFDHGIEKKVPTRDLEIMVSESHMSHSKKKKM